MSSWSWVPLERMREFVRKLEFQIMRDRGSCREGEELEKFVEKMKR